MSMHIHARQRVARVAHLALLTRLAPMLLGSCTLILGSEPNTPLQLSAQATAAGSVELSWTDTSTGTRNEDGFRVERRLGLLGAYEPLVTLERDTTQHSDDFSLISGLQYSYRVAAFNIEGESNWSNQADAVAEGTSSASFDGGNVSGSGMLIASGGGTVDINGHLTVDTYDATWDVTYLEGDFDVQTFIHNGGWVAFTNDRGLASNVYGSNTFFALAVDAPDKLMRFAAGQTQRVDGTLYVQGDPDALVKLVSTDAVGTWTLDNVGDTEAIDHALIHNSQVLSNDVTVSNGLDAGGNDLSPPGWVFQ